MDFKMCEFKRVELDELKRPIVVVQHVQHRWLRKPLVKELRFLAVRPLLVPDTFEWVSLPEKRLVNGHGLSEQLCVWLSEAQGVVRKHR